MDIEDALLTLGQSELRVSSVKMNLFLKGLYLVTLMLLLSYSEAADSIGRYYNEKYPGKCYILPDLILSPGEIAPYPDRDCAIVTCKPNSMGRRQT